jgi:competence protein ComEC
MNKFTLLLAFGFVPLACGGASVPPPTQPAPPPASTSPPPSAVSSLSVPSAPLMAEALRAPREPRCGGAPLTVHFINVGQALSVLVDLPDGNHVLVDTGDSRPGTQGAHKHMMNVLTSDLGSAPIDLLWITHQHADHIGGAHDVLSTFKVKHYVDNGTVPHETEISTVHDEAKHDGVPTDVVDPSSQAIPLHETGDVKLTAIAPSQFSPKCASSDRNLCSIMLRIDYCASSVLLTGDEEQGEEASFPPMQPVTLLQAGHHGSKTSSGDDFLAALQPKYVVISAGKPDEGQNRGYCHPARTTVESLTRGLGGPGARTIAAFDGQKCERGVSHLASFVDVPASDRLWATERDGDVVLTTTGDGTFSKK